LKTQSFLKKYTLLFFLLLFFNSCIETPVKTDENLIEDYNVAIILCEGLKGYNNSTISRISLNDYTVEKNSFRLRNDENLGDTANDIMVFGDTAFVAVTASNRIEIFRISDGVLIDAIQLPDNYYPRNFAFVNKNRAYVTNLRNHSITFFNPSTFEVIEESIECGFFPEDIEYAAGKLFIANSGLGYFYKDNPLSNTMTVMNETDHTILNYIEIGQNMQEIEISEKHNKIFALYYNTYERDSVGGFVEINMFDYKITNHFKINALNLTKNDIEDRIYFFRQTPKGQVEEAWRGLSYYDINSGEINDYIENGTKTEFWYGMEFRNNEIWVCNAKNFLMNGEIIIFNKIGNELRRLETGINPNNIRFY
jgi:hypothetical protein